MKFSNLVKIFFEISKENSRLTITNHLANLYKNLDPEESKLATYFAMGIMGPSYKEDTQFNFAQKNIEKVLSHILNLSLEDIKNLEKNSEDLSTIINNSNWPYTDNNLEITEVYNYLSRLKSISGVGSQEEKSILLIKLFEKLDYLSASFVIKIILGTMRLGFSDMTIIDALSYYLSGDKSLKNQIEEKYNICADLGLIAYQIKLHGIKGLKNINSTIAIPIRPAAAERASSATEIINKIGQCIAQPKLDGFRLQIHFQKNILNNNIDIWFYSRNLQNMSNMFPDLVQSLKDILKNKDIENIILEGEAIVFDQNSQTFLPFQETVKRKRKHSIDEIAQDLPLKLFIFDILHINSSSTLDLAYNERRNLLLNIFDTNIENRICLIEEKFCKTDKDISNYFEENITKGFEGLVVKRHNTNYQPGKRNFNWIKLKRQENQNLSDTIDAVILGYYKGHGRRAKFEIGAFLVGIYNKEKDAFESIAKIGTGLKDNDWAELKIKCNEIKVNSKPNNIICSSELEPDVWVNPEIVVMILADQITQSPTHSAAKTEELPGLALRFPRFIGYAVDKKATQATDSIELRRLYNLQFSK